MAGGRAQHRSGRPVCPAAQDHRRGARVQGPGPGRAGRQWIRRHAAAGRYPEADRRRSAHRFAARFRHALGRPAGGAAACAAMRVSKTLFRENDADDAFGMDYLQDRIDREFPWRGTSASRSIPPTTALSCSARRSPRTPITRALPSAAACSARRARRLGMGHALPRGTRARRRRRDPGIDDPLLGAGPAASCARNPQGTAAGARGEVSQDARRVPAAAASACTSTFTTAIRSLPDSTASSWQPSTRSAS